MTQNIEEEKSSQKEKHETSSSNSEYWTEQELQLAAENNSAMVERFRKRFSDWSETLPENHSYRVYKEKRKTKETK